MLDQTTKRKLDSARQILVGKVPDPKAQVEQITTALVYKFMDDMDKEAEELGGEAKFFAKDFQKYSWTKLMDPKLSGADRLDLYVQAITNMSKNPHIPQLFRDIFKGAFLPYNDPRTLSLFLKEINEFNYEHSENLGNAFEYLLSILGSQGDAGQFRTPRHIIDFIVEVVDPKKNETILDPACGTAGFLISAYKHILKQHDGVDEHGKKNNEKPLTPDERLKMMNNFAGYDISPDMVKLALVNLYLHGFPEPKIYEYDTLTSEKRWDETFDVILANPPFMTPKGGINPHKRFSIQANRAEVLFVDYIMEHLTIKGRAGIIVPEGIIFQSNNAYKALRKKLVEDGLLAVVSLPSGVFQPYSGVKTSILIFDKEIAKLAKDILFVKVENDGFDLGAQRREIDKNDLPQALSIIQKFKKTQSDKDFTDEEMKMSLLVERSKIAESGDYNLTGERYRVSEMQINQKWPMVELGELEKQEKITFLRGQGISKKDIVENGKNKCIHYGEIYTLYKPIISNVISRTNSEGKILSKKGDVLVPSTTTADALGIAVARSLNQDGVILGGDINIIRTENKHILSDFLAYLISNSSVKQQLASYAKGVNILHLSNSDLRKLKIPLPPIEVQKEIVEQIEVKQNAINAAREVIKNLERERRYFGQSLRKLEGVEWVELGEICDTTSGGTPLKNKQEYYENGTVPWLKSGEVAQGLIFSSEGMITDLGLKNSSAKIFPINTILIAMYGATAGKVGLLKFESATNQAICGVLPNEKYLPEFLYMYLRTMTDEMVKLSGGGAQPNISQTIIKALKIPLPSPEIQKQLVAEAEKEQEIIDANKRLIEIMEKKIEEVLSEI